MGSVNLVIIVESARSLITHGDGDTNKFDVAAVAAVASALGKPHLLQNLDQTVYQVAPQLGTKFLLFLYCFSIRKNSSQVQVLWEDHRNDLWVNSFGTFPE